MCRVNAAAIPLAIAILVVTIACASPPTATPSSSPAVTAPTATPSSSPAVAAPIATVDTLACRLPVTWTSWDPATRVWADAKTGFLALPDLSLSEDQGGHLVPVSDFVARTSGSPSLSGSRIVRYDAARQR